MITDGYKFNPKKVETGKRILPIDQKTSKLKGIPFDKSQEKI
jgi:hypothetical protein